MDSEQQVAGIPHQFLVRFVRLFDAIRLQLALRLKQRLGGSASPNLTYGILQQASGTPLFISFQAVQLQVISFKFYFKNAAAFLL